VEALFSAKEDVMGKGIVLLLFIMFGAMWLIIKPGIFIVDPTSSMPEGTTLIYLNKPAGIPVFRSTDAICTDTYGSTSGSCREQILQAQAGLFQQSLVELPYMAWLEDMFTSKPPTP
jgi:hypothetical protein